jgi:hypothetical protein
VTDHGSDILALPDTFKKRIKLLEEWHLNVLAIWEFKSLAAGSKDIMRAIQGLSSQESFLGRDAHHAINAILLTITEVTAYPTIRAGGQVPIP